jgi:hypothetical protein
MADDAPNLFDFLGEFLKTAEPVPAEVHTFHFGPPSAAPRWPDVNITMTPMSLGDAALARCIGTGESAMVTWAGEPYQVASATPSPDGDIVYLLTPVGEPVAMFGDASEPVEADVTFEV